MNNLSHDHKKFRGRAGLPQVRIESHLAEAEIDLEQFHRLVTAALPLCVNKANPGSPLPLLEEVEVAMVDDATIARVHDEYLNEPTATDVITFDHGEIVISYDTALREAGERGLPLTRELLLYVVHGLLHLAGHDDIDHAARRRMSALQESIVGSVYGRVDD